MNVTSFTGMFEKFRTVQLVVGQGYGMHSKDHTTKGKAQHLLGCALLCHASLPICLALGLACVCMCRAVPERVFGSDPINSAVETFGKPSTTRGCYDKSFDGGRDVPGYFGFSTSWGWVFPKICWMMIHLEVVV